MAGGSGPRVVTFGETMALVRTRDVGSLRHATDLALAVGGAESNVAIGLRRLGVESSWLGRVGDDPMGERVLREIRAEGVDVHGIVDADATTGLMIKERSAASTAVYYYRSGSAGSRLEAGDLPEGWVEGATLLHVSGITALVSDTASTCLSFAVDRAKTAGVLVSFDVNYRSSLAAASAAGPILRSIAEQADIVFGGAEELALLHPDADPAASATRLLESGCAHVVLKRGADGATVFARGDVVEATSFDIDVVDTVGAGDAFVAGYLSAVLGGLDVPGALRRANAAGAIACRNPGDWESAPTLRDIERFLDGGDPVRR